MADVSSQKRLTAQDTGTPPSRTMRKPATPGSASPLLPQLRKGMTPSAHSPLLTTSMHGGLGMDHLSTPTPAPPATQHPASVFKRASARQPLAVSRTMEATRGQIKTISSAAKHSLLTSHRSPAARLSASPDVKSSPPIRSKPALTTARQPSTVKPQADILTEPVDDVKAPSPAVTSPAPPSAQVIAKERIDTTNGKEATPVKQERTPTKSNTPPVLSASETVTPRSKTRKTVEGVEIRSETRQAVVSIQGTSRNVLQDLTCPCSQDKIWEVFGEVIRSDEDMQDTTGKPDPEQTM